MQVIEKKAAEN